MNIPAATRIDRDTSDRAQRLRSRTFLTMSEMLRIGLLRVLEEFEANGNISSGDGVPVTARVATKAAKAAVRQAAAAERDAQAQTSNANFQPSTAEPPTG